MRRTQRVTEVALDRPDRAAMLDAAALRVNESSGGAYGWRQGGTPGQCCVPRCTHWVVIPSVRACEKCYRRWHRSGRPDWDAWIAAGAPCPSQWRARLAP